MADILYPFSRQEAQQNGELEQWRQSRRTNISCARNLSGLLDSHTQNGQLDPNTAQISVKNWGIRRLQYVLANTLNRTGGLGFEPDSLRWARSVLIPPDRDNARFRIQADREVLAQFVQQTYAEYQKLGMFGPEHCDPAPDQDYTGKVLILRPDRLKEDCWSAQNQLWYGQTGFGLSPTSSGRAVFATCLGDGEKARLNRSDFIGVLDEQYLPDWAQEKLAELRGSQEQTDTPAQGGMEMR